MIKADTLGLIWPVVRGLPINDLHVVLLTSRWCPLSREGSILYMLVARCCVWRLGSPFGQLWELGGASAPSCKLVARRSMFPMWVVRVGGSLIEKAKHGGSRGASSWIWTWESFCHLAMSYLQGLREFGGKEVCARCWKNGGARTGKRVDWGKRARVPESSYIDLFYSKWMYVNEGNGRDICWTRIAYVLALGAGPRIMWSDPRIST